MEVAKEVLQGVVDQLAPQDSLAIVLFRWGLGWPNFLAGLAVRCCGWHAALIQRLH